MSNRFSIITPTRNMAHFLEPCILSIMQQFYGDFEHIVIDGASTDNTLEILKRYPHIRWISEPDRGLSDALNKGIRMATGNIIGWCNADDLYLPGTLTVANDLFERNPEVAVLYGDYRETDELGVSLRVRRETHFSSSVFNWLHVNIIPTPSAFWRRDIHDQDLWFDEKMRFAMDYDFLRRAHAKGFQFKHVGILFCDFRRHGGSLTAAGGQLQEHEAVVYRDSRPLWKKLGPLFPVLRKCFLLVARVERTLEKCLKGLFFDSVRR